MGGESSIFVVLTQLNDRNKEKPITFFSEGLKEYKDEYNYVEKKTLMVIRVLKNFRNLISHNKIHLLVPHASVKDFLLRKDINEKREGWITKVMEYDVDIQVTKLVRGKGLCKQMVSSHESDEEVSLVLVEQQEVRNKNLRSWIDDMKTLLAINWYPQGLDRVKRR